MHPDTLLKKHAQWMSETARAAPQTLTKVAGYGLAAHCDEGPCRGRPVSRSEGWRCDKCGAAWPKEAIEVPRQMGERGEPSDKIENLCTFGLLIRNIERRVRPRAYTAWRLHILGPLREEEAWTSDRRGLALDEVPEALSDFELTHGTGDGSRVSIYQLRRLLEECHRAAKKEIRRVGW